MGTRLGEGVAVFGYPHADILASSGNVTLGNAPIPAALAVLCRNVAHRPGVTVGVRHANRRETP